MKYIILIFSSLFLISCDGACVPKSALMVSTLDGVWESKIMDKRCEPFYKEAWRIIDKEKKENKKCEIYQATKEEPAYRDMCKVWVEADKRCHALPYKEEQMERLSGPTVIYDKNNQPAFIDGKPICKESTDNKKPTDKKSTDNKSSKTTKE